MLIHFLCKTMLLPVLLILSAPAMSSRTYYDSVNKAKHKRLKQVSIREKLQCFFPLSNATYYSITVCADVPVNKNPSCVYKKGEPGHVFLILSRYDSLTNKTTSCSFGFYPHVPVSCLIKQVRSKIVDNSNRTYDASIEKKITKEAFAAVLQNSIELSKKKYNLKKFNCYDYVLNIYNSIPGVEKLPFTKVKFPFILGRGGSPCGLYSDLRKIAVNGSVVSAQIKFGLFTSPMGDNTPPLMVSH